MRQFGESEKHFLGFGEAFFFGLIAGEWNGSERWDFHFRQRILEHAQRMGGAGVHGIGHDDDGESRRFFPFLKLNGNEFEAPGGEGG